MSRGLTSLLLLAALLPPMAPASAQAPTRHLLRDVARYLELRPEQHGRLAEIEAGWQGYLADAHRRAASIDQAPAAQRAQPAERLCAESRERQQLAERDARALLDAPQRTRLAELERALQLLPVIESAQAAHLLPPQLMLPPAAMPEGQVEVAVRFVRAEPMPLPGCPARSQNTRPGVEPVDPASPRRPPS